MEKKQRTAIESGVLLFIVAGILVALNAFSAFGLYARIDATKTEKYKLSKGSKHLISTMKQSVNVEAYVTKGLPKLDALVQDLRDLLLEYKQSSDGHFDFSIKEAKDEDAKKEAKTAGLVERPFVSLSDTDETGSFAKGFMGLIITYGTEKGVIPFVDRADGLEFWLSNKLRELQATAENSKHEVGVITGHDEIKLSDANIYPASGRGGGPSTLQIITHYFPFYVVKDVDLKGGDAPIDEKLDGIIITQPGKDYTEKELKAIDAFVMKGKSLVVLAGAVNMDAGKPQMNANLNTHGLDKILDGYGITLNKDVILDFGRAFYIGLQVEGGVAQMQFPQFLWVTDDPRFSGDQQLLDTSFAAFFRDAMITMPFASSLEIHNDKQPEAKFGVHARSTPRSGRLVQDSVSLAPFESNGSPRKWPKPAKWGQYAVAASVEGTLVSAFPDKDKPQKSEADARVLVIASPQFLANPLARAAGGGADPMHPGGGGGDEELSQLAGMYLQQGFERTILSFKNVLDWMSGDTDLLAASAKLQSDPNLVFGDVTNPGDDLGETDEAFFKKQSEAKKGRKELQLVVAVTLIVGIPVIIALLGLLRWRLRLRARETVSLA